MSESGQLQTPNDVRSDGSVFRERTPRHATHAHPGATVAAIEAALSKYKVIFFRDQGHLDDAEQERFAARLGDLVAHPTARVRAGSAAVLEIDSTDGRGRAARW